MNQLLFVCCLLFLEWHFNRWKTKDGKNQTHTLAPFTVLSICPSPSYLSFPSQKTCDSCRLAELQCCSMIGQKPATTAAAAAAALWFNLDEPHFDVCHCFSVRFFSCCFPPCAHSLSSSCCTVPKFSAVCFSTDAAGTTILSGSL